MTYLFFGQDNAAKDAKIEELKKKIFTSPESLKFDYEILYAQKLEPETLKKALMALPAMAKKRLVIVKECHRLSPHNQELVLEFVRNPGPCVLVLDSEKLEADDSFAKKLKSFVTMAPFKKGPKIDVFTLTRAISMRQETDALKILSHLLSQGEQPLQIMGGLVWFWKNSRDGFSSEEFKKGLLTLQEADLNIKRSRLKPEHALELAVVKLCSKEVY